MNPCAPANFSFRKRRSIGLLENGSGFGSKGNQPSTLGVAASADGPSASIKVSRASEMKNRVGIAGVGRRRRDDSSRRGFHPYALVATHSSPSPRTHFRITIRPIRQARNLALLASGSILPGIQTTFAPKVEHSFREDGPEEMTTQ